MGKKIFITGVAGFLGSHLADTLLAQGHDVFGCDTLIGGYQDNVPKGVTFHEKDCTDVSTMRSLLEGVDIVYHTAALAYEGLSVFSPDLITQNIIGGTSAVVSAAITNNVKRFVFTSSMARYGTNKVPFSEDLIPQPQDPYGIAKEASERLLRNMADVHGLKCVIAVPHNIIGPRQKYDDPFRNVASIFINKMLRGEQPIIYGDGEQVRCFSFVQDCIQCLERMGFQDDVVGETINIGPDEGSVTINELAQTIAGLIDFDVKPIYKPGRPQEVILATCSADKARRMLGYKTEYTLEQGLQEMIDYIQERGTKPFTYHLDLEIINDKTPKTWTDKLI